MKKDQPPPYLRCVWPTPMSLVEPSGNAMIAVRLAGSMVPFARKRETRTLSNSSRKRRPMASARRLPMRCELSNGVLVARGTSSTRHDGGPPVLLDHHPAAALVVLEIGLIAFPGPGHAVVVEWRLATRHPR